MVQLKAGRKERRTEEEKQALDSGAAAAFVAGEREGERCVSDLKQSRGWNDKSRGRTERVHELQVERRAQERKEHLPHSAAH